MNKNVHTKIINKYPNVKIGLDSFYGYQTVQNMLHENTINSLKFMEWVHTHYRKVPGGYMPNKTRLTTSNSVLTIEELYEEYNS